MLQNVSQGIVTTQVSGYNGKEVTYVLVFATWMLGAGALGRPRGMEWGGRREEGLGWGTHVYLWRIHFDIWQN